MPQKDKLPLLTPRDVRERGLEMVGVRCDGRSDERLEKEFEAHFGSSSLVVATQWHDVCNTEDLLEEGENSWKGFKRFLIAIFWLWTRPKNAHLVASRFDVCLDYCRGRPLWKWIEYLAAIAEKKIVWDDGAVEEIIAYSADGVDYVTWERQHEHFPIDQESCSHKSKHCAVKYVVLLSLHQSKVVYIAGPYKGGTPDLTIFREHGLIDFLRSNGKVCMADLGFRSRDHEHERECFALPDLMNTKELYNYKSRARLRHETFNSRVNMFESMSETWRHGEEKHGVAYRACAGTVQYQMDNGKPLFDV